MKKGQTDSSMGIDKWMNKVRAARRSKVIEMRGDGWMVAARETAGSWTHTFAFEVASEQLDG